MVFKHCSSVLYSLLWMGLFFLLLSCSHECIERVQVDTVGLRNGDLLFRKGSGYESHLVTNMSGGYYSHIGLAYKEGQQWCVIHAVPGENAEGQPEYLKCEPIDEFFRFDRAQAGARARVNCPDSIANAASSHALQLVQRKVVFDNKYNTDDTTQLYCTELVRLVYLSLGIDLSEDRCHRPPVLSDGPVIYPEDIWVSPLLIHKQAFSKSL